MHQSRLSSIIIDCQTDNLDAAAEFWGRALGRTVRLSADGDTKYRDLTAADDPLILMAQKVDHPSRVHLDIESDDVEAEVRRLEVLGAKRIEKIKTWWVLEAPTGQRFCVVRQQRGPLEGRANRWPDNPSGATGRS